jgi:hypothetical protein
MKAHSAFEEISIDRVQDYWNSRPCNIRHSTAPIGTKEYFDQVEARKYFVEYHIPGFADFQRWRGRKVPGNRLRHRHGYHQLCPRRRAGHHRRPFGQIHGTGPHSHLRLRPPRAHPLLPGQCRAAQHFRSRRALRSDLFFRRDSSHAAPGGGAGAVAAIHAAGGRR